VVLGCLAGAAIGCATIILCILAIIVAALIAAVAVLVGAFIGGQIGKNSQPDTSPADAQGNEIVVGDYVSLTGKMTVGSESNRISEFEGARVLWFVESTALHGRSSGSPPFGFPDPDTNLLSDACPRRDDGTPVSEPPKEPQGAPPPVP
jgi:hypothetical protein